MKYIGWVDVPWVPVLVVVFVFLIASVMFPSCFGGVSLSSPLCIDAFEDTTFFHRVVRLGMELAESFQHLVVVFLIITSSIGTFDCVYLVIVVARSLASDVITVVAMPIPPFSVVAVVATTRVPDVEAFTAVVSSGMLLSSSNIFSNELFCVVGVDVILGCGEKFGDHGRPLA